MATEEITVLIPPAMLIWTHYCTNVLVNLVAKFTQILTQTPRLGGSSATRPASLRPHEKSCERVLAAELTRRIDQVRLRGGFRLRGDLKPTCVVNHVTNRRAHEPKRGRLEAPNLTLFIQSSHVDDFGKLRAQPVVSYFVDRRAAKDTTSMRRLAVHPTIRGPSVRQGLHGRHGGAF